MSWFTHVLAIRTCVATCNRVLQHPAPDAFPLAFSVTCYLLVFAAICTLRTVIPPCHDGR